MRPGISIILSPADRRRLEALVGDRNVAQKHVWRARIVLHSADGIGTNGIMRRTGKSKTCVWRWQERFAQEGYDGLLRDKTRPSRIPPLGPEVGRAGGRPDAERPARRGDPLGRRHDGQGDRHQRQLGAAHLARTRGFGPIGCGNSSFRTIPTSSPNCAMWSGSTSTRRPTPSCSRSTKSRRSRRSTAPSPAWPMKKGRLGTMTHDYKRHGTTTLFAALNVLEGKVIGRCMQRHRHQEFIRFLNAIEADIPAGKGVHVILDNYAAHKHAKVRAWLGRHERFTFHFVPTSCSWLNAVEGFFAKLSKRAPETRRLPLHCRPPGRHQPLPRRDQRQPKALHLDRRSRQNHRRRQTRASSVRFDPLAAPLAG